MNEYVILAIVLSIVLPISCFFLIRFIQGYYSIESIEEITSQDYDVTKGNPILGYVIPAGKIRRITYKYVYESKRIKFVTKEFKI